MQHIVEKGETLMAIAKEYNTSLAEIIQINNLKNPNSIQIGQIIEIPNPETKLVTHSILTVENINEKIEKFFNFIEGKKLKRPLTSIGRECVKLIFQKCLELKVTDLRMISYILATTHWETGAYGQRFIYEPVPEQGKGKTRPYIMVEGLYN